MNNICRASIGFEEEDISGSSVSSTSSPFYDFLEVESMEDLLYLKPVDAKAHVETLLDKLNFKDTDDIKTAEDKVAVLTETIRLLGWKIRVVRGEQELFSKEDNRNEFNKPNFSFAFNLRAFRAARLYEDMAREANQAKWRAENLKELQSMIESKEVLITNIFFILSIFVWHH